MADRLYLSLWYPNFRLESLPATLAGVLRQFAQVGAKRVSAASAYPINFTEPPTYQRIYAEPPPTNFDPTVPIDPSPDTSDERIDAAVAEATEQLHDDMAYEFEMRWMLWIPDTGAGMQGAELDTAWRLEPAKVRITGFGPEFDAGSYEQNGHIRVDFGLDTPWVLEDELIDRAAAERIKQNVEKLLAFTLSVEKNCGISSRLLWTESGEPLAEKLIARLQRLN